jgi:hypothetical protein
MDSIASHLAALCGAEQKSPGSQAPIATARSDWTHRRTSASAQSKSVHDIDRIADDGIRDAIRHRKGQSEECVSSRIVSCFTQRRSANLRANN